MTNGARVDSLDRWHETPLHYAAATASVSIVQLLLSNRAQPNPVSAHHMIPLHYAALSGSEAIVQILLDCGVKVDSTGFPKRSSKKKLADFGHSYVTQIIGTSASRATVTGLTKDMQVFAEGHWHSTALHYAAEKGHEEVVKLLLKKGASKYAKNQRGVTARYLAEKAGYPDIAKLCTAMVDKGFLSV